jgi:hypothetical protein
MGRTPFPIRVRRFREMRFENVRKVIAVKPLPHPFIAIDGAIVNNFLSVFERSTVILIVRKVKTATACQLSGKLLGDKNLQLVGCNKPFLWANPGR